MASAGERPRPGVFLHVETPPVSELVHLTLHRVKRGLHDVKRAGPRIEGMMGDDQSPARWKRDANANPVGIVGLVPALRPLDDDPASDDVRHVLLEAGHAGADHGFDLFEMSRVQVTNAKFERLLHAGFVIATAVPHAPRRESQAAERGVLSSRGA